MGNGKTMTDMMMQRAAPTRSAIGHMGITAENVASRHQITREEQDAFALESQKSRRGNAIEQKATVQRARLCRSTIEETQRNQSPSSTDEHVRMGAKIEDMSKLRPAFKKDGGSVTAGNASGINDGAAADCAGQRRKEAARRGAKPMAQYRVLRAGGRGAFEVMGMGPAPATRNALEKAGLAVSRSRRDREQRGLRRPGLRRLQGSRPRRAPR